ncbi:MAG: hypothetical protein FWE24_02460 [Defluviitaleaceae bacterium]|nr:hypothetical protein [Defluviitaleaceae bacterium]
MSKITDRILTELGDKELIEKLLALPKSDLNSLMLEVFKEQAKDINPADVLKAFQTNRFSLPSEIDPIDYHICEAELLSLARKLEIEAVLLSPSAPLGSCSAFGCVNQNNIISASRGVEILPDPTNMLAIIIAQKLKNEEADNHNQLHFCTTARVQRANPIPKAKGFYSHFGIFCIVSTGKDRGSYICENALFVKQLHYYRKLLIERYNARLSVVLRKRSGYIDSDGFFNKMTELVKIELPDVPISFDLEHEDNNYYKGINFKLYMEKENEKIEIGDGGFVDWISKMTNRKKERCLISGIGLDRLLLL